MTLNRQTKNELAVVGFVTVLCGSLWSFYWMGYRLNYTHSLPWGVYRETSDLIHYGTVVAECLPPHLAAFGKKRGWLIGGYCPTETPPIMKQVVAMAGDTVELTDKFVAVNGIKIPQSATQKTDSKGREIPTMPRGRYVIKPGEVFLLATNIPNSWDGRYTGPARVSDIIATARPVWTEGRK